MKLILTSMIFFTGILLTGCSENEPTQPNVNEPDSTTQFHNDGFKKSSRKSYTVGSIKEAEDK